MQDGTIYLSGNSQSSYYVSQEVHKKYDTVFFGWKPYFRFDPATNVVTDMPDIFVPNFSKVRQPKIARLNDEFSEVNIAKRVRLLTGKNIFVVY